MSDLSVRLVSEPGNLDRATRGALNRLERRCFSQEGVYPRKDRGYWWMVYHGEEPVAYAGLELFLDEEVGFLCRVGVVPEYRGRGIQRKMMCLRERKARALGMKGVVSYTGLGNHHSLVNFIKRGYKVYRPDKPWAGVKLIYFRKQFPGFTWR